MRSGLKILPLVGAGSLLLAHLLTAAAFRKRANAMIARLEHARVTEPSTPPVPAIIHSFARRAVCETPVPTTVWLRQSGEMRASLRGRVEMWRGDCRPNISVAAPFVWRCLTGSTVAPFPHPAHRTGRADFPHPALGQDLTPSPTARCAHAQSGVRDRNARRGARVDKSRPCVA